MDPSSIIPAVLSTATLVSNVVSSAKNARDIAKQSQNADVKDAVSDLYDSIIDIKQRVVDLDEENRNLREQLRMKANIARDPETGYYHVDGEENQPLCQRCYEKDGKRAYLGKLTQEERGQRRSCLQCNNSFWETRYSQRSRLVNNDYPWG